MSNRKVTIQLSWSHTILVDADVALQVAELLDGSEVIDDGYLDVPDEDGVLVTGRVHYIKEHPFKTNLTFVNEDREYMAEADYNAAKELQRQQEEA